MKIHVVAEQDGLATMRPRSRRYRDASPKVETREEALANVREVVEGWLEVMEAKRELDPTRTVEVVV